MNFQQCGARAQAIAPGLEHIALSVPAKHPNSPKLRAW